MRLVSWLVALVAACALSSCSRSTVIELYNATSSALAINLPSETIAIDAHRTRKFRPGVLADAGDTLSIRLANCVHSYPLRQVFETYPWRQPQHLVPMQLNADLLLYVLPEGVDLAAGDVQLSEAVSVVAPNSACSEQ